MLEYSLACPVAVASHDAEGIEAAINWCCEFVVPGDSLWVWTKSRSRLWNCSQLEQFVDRYVDAVHINGRRGESVHNTGLVLLAGADMDDIGNLLQLRSHLVRALCVITWNGDALGPWVSQANPTILGDGSAWKATALVMDALVAEAMEALTMMVNHDSTIAAGAEKDSVVSVLLALHDEGIAIDAANLQGWALAHGWSGTNPRRLARYVDQIAAGKRPRRRQFLRANYFTVLRARITKIHE